jgi:catechol 2,3-dioxygenase-like lactoylglutathione lyase family enzyme
MDKRLGTITLGVRDLARARQFYETGLGWTRDGGESDIAFYQLNGMVFGLYEWPAFAEHAGAGGAAAAAGFRGCSFGYCTRTRAEVDAVVGRAAAAGATINVPPRDAFWGGYNAYFTDLDGHLWEVAWNPHLTITERGEHLMKHAD